MSTTLIIVREAVRSILSNSSGKTVPDNQRILEILKSKFRTEISNATVELIDDVLQKLISDELSRRMRRKANPFQTDIFSSLGDIIDINNNGVRNTKIITEKASLRDIEQALANDLSKKEKLSGEIDSIKKQIEQVKGMISNAGSDDLTLIEYIQRFPKAA